MKKRWYAILVALAFGLFFCASKTAEYFVSINYNKDTYNWLLTIQNVWFVVIVIGICFVGYKTKKVVFPIICAILLICGCTAINEGHYSNTKILTPAKIIVEEQNIYLVMPLELEDGAEARYRAVNLLKETLHEGVYDWVELDYHDSPRHGRQYYIVQVSEQKSGE